MGLERVPLFLFAKISIGEVKWDVDINLIIEKIYVYADIDILLKAAVITVNEIEKVFFG